MCRPTHVPGGTGGSRTHKTPRFELGRCTGSRTVPSVSAFDGIRTRNLHRDRVASYPVALQRRVSSSIPPSEFRIPQSRAPGGSRTHSSTLARWQASRYITGAGVVTSTKPPAGVEPARPSYQGGRLPLHHRGGRPVSPPGVEPGLQPSEGRVRFRHTPRTFRAPGGNRTRNSGLEDRRVPGYATGTLFPHRPGDRCHQHNEARGTRTLTPGLRDRSAAANT